jgi:hypothetical protein
MNKYIAIAQGYKKRFENILTGKWAYKLQEIYGLSQEEINTIELKYHASLPQSYKIFLSEFGNTPKSFLLDLDMGDEHPLVVKEKKCRVGRCPRTTSSEAITSNWD